MSGGKSTFSVEDLQSISFGFYEARIQPI
jgi:hypothetical protein